MRRRIAMDQLPRHVNIGEIHYHKGNKTNGGKQSTFYCEECDRVYPIRYMDRHHRTYKHQRNLLMLENVP